ncbi:WGR domain-containing protein [Streptomyces solicathayae]|uniref:WGR domain-containing protein n=1 Tax=Streptomyces solicathayae TaxID=3081768 RepID=A0ABZ0LL83_9ACTN|nr:WGR domain-containing protein [Streptomyces sp. HUAS YS2]WOX20045.1 WGR domain-containing protein [Streptomyces sp. HUAS YS2]
METQRFEKSSGGVVRYWQISRDGIRCHMSWGQVGGRTQGSSMTLDDEAHAKRHFGRKVSEKRRQGYVEVASGAATETTAASADATADDKLLDVMRAQEEKRYEGAWDAYWAGYEQVEGYDGVFAKFHDFAAGPGPFYDYVVLSEDERRGLHFVVKKPGHDPRSIAAFLDFVRPRLELAFDGHSHHKVPLPSPIGQFDHVLFCAPSLCRNRYGGRLGKAIPILDCEISDEDSETFVEARLQGRGSMPSTTWDREPFPVIDLKFDLRGANSVREKAFKVYPRSMLERGIQLLSEALPGSWLEIRNHRRDVLTLTPTDLTDGTPAEIDRFLLGDSAQA